MPSLLESRHRLLHLRASVERKWSQPRYPSMDIGSSLNSELCHSEGATSFPSIWDHIAHNLRKRCIKRGFEGIHDRFQKILHFENLNSKLIELKKSVSRWTTTRRRISPIEWRKMSTFDTKRIGGSLSTSLEKSDRWEIVLTSTMRWPHHTVFTKNLEKNNSRQLHSGNTSNGTHHRVLHPAHLGDNGTILRELMTINKKVRNWAHVKSDMIERWDPLCRLFTNLRRVDFQDFLGLLQLDRLQLTVVCCNRREVWTPHLTRRISHRISCPRMAKVWVRTSMLHAHFVSDCPLFDDSTFLCPSFCPSTSSSRMWWTNSLCTSANEDLGTLAEYDPLTEAPSFFPSGVLVDQLDQVCLAGTRCGCACARLILPMTARVRSRPCSCSLLAIDRDDDQLSGLSGLYLTHEC